MEEEGWVRGEGVKMEGGRCFDLFFLDLSVDGTNGTEGTSSFNVHICLMIFSLHASMPRPVVPLHACG